MKFYVIANAEGSTVGCETSLRRAKQFVKAEAREGYTITCITCKPDAETVRRLLGNLGGFAEDSVEVML